MDHRPPYLVKRGGLLVVLGSVALVLASCSTAETDPASSTPSGGSPVATETVGGASATPTDEADEAAISGGLPATPCDISAGEWAGVVDASQPATGQDDALREGVPLLESRVSAWREISRDAPAVSGIVDLAAEIADQWRAALAALDDGDVETADAALDSAEQLSDDLAEQVAALPPDACEAASQ